MVTRNPKDSAARQRAIRERLEKAEAGHAPAWKKDEHPFLAGGLDRYTAFKGSSTAGPCRVAVIDDEDLGLTSVYIRNAMLVELFSEKRPRPGEWVTLRFLGKPEGSRMNFYALEVDRDPANEQPAVPDSFDVPDQDNDGEAEHAPDDPVPF